MKTKYLIIRKVFQLGFNRGAFDTFRIRTFSINWVNDIIEQWWTKSITIYEVSIEIFEYHYDCIKAIGWIHNLWDFNSLLLNK